MILGSLFPETRFYLLLYFRKVVIIREEDMLPTYF